MSIPSRSVSRMTRSCRCVAARGLGGGAAWDKGAGRPAAHLVVHKTDAVDRARVDRLRNRLRVVGALRERARAPCFRLHEEAVASDARAVRAADALELVHVQKSELNGVAVFIEVQLKVARDVGILLDRFLYLPQSVELLVRAHPSRVVRVEESLHQPCIALCILSADRHHGRSSAGNAPPMRSHARARQLHARDARLGPQQQHPDQGAAVDRSVHGSTFARWIILRRGGGALNSETVPMPRQARTVHAGISRQSRAKRQN